MPTWEKVPQENAEAFDRALPDEPDIERRKMFGCPAAFVNGNMFCGAHESNINVRLPETLREKAFQQGFQPFSVHGKTMREYACAPADKVTDEAFLHEWFSRALEYARTLPPKQPKSKKKRA